MSDEREGNVKYKVSITVNVEAPTGDFAGALGNAQDAISAGNYGEAEVTADEPFVIKFGIPRMTDEEVLLEIEIDRKLVERTHEVFKEAMTEVPDA